MARLLVFVFAMASVSSADPVIGGEVKLERSTCRGTKLDQTCSDYQTIGTQSFSVYGDSGLADYLKFDLGDGKVAEVKIGTNGGGGPDFFLTTGLFAHDESKAFIINGETIFQIDKKDSLRTVQIYSPTYDDNGTLRDLKASIQFTRFSD